MDDLKGAIAEINHVTAFQQTASGSSPNTIPFRVPSVWHTVKHCVGRISVSQRPFVPRIGQDRRFSLVHATLREFVMAPDMIEMGVARNADKRTLRDKRNVVTKTEMAKARIKQ